MLSTWSQTRNASAVGKSRLESESPEQQLQALGWAGAGQARLPHIVLVTDSAGGSWAPGAVRDNSQRCLATVCGKPSGGLSRPQPHPMEMFLTPNDKDMGHLQSQTRVSQGEETRELPRRQGHWARTCL